MQPPDKPLMIFDGDCGFCRRWIARWRVMTGDRVNYEPYQTAAERFPEIPIERFRNAVHVIEPDGTVTSAAEAVLRSLANAPGKAWMTWTYGSVPGVAPITEAAYRYVARHRRGMSTITHWLWGRHVEPSTFVCARWLFLRLIGVVYLIAFLSLGSQIIGLIGEQSILPAQRWLDWVGRRFGSDAWLRAPTLCWWWGASDATLRWMCGGGIVLAGLLIGGIAQGPMLLALWALYLSLSIVGQDFLSFQWDALLLEAGLISVFVAPWRIVPRRTPPRAPPPIAWLLLYWLIFKLMFLSGMTKLAFDDPTWWDLTALTYHYETQPIPTWASWYVHHWPVWLHKVSTVSMYVIEIAVPLLIVTPRRLRHLAAVLLIMFQIMIAATGNYGFFNLLTAMLCVPLFDDALLGGVLPAKFRRWVDEAIRAPAARWWTRIAAVCFAMVALTAGGVASLQEMGALRDPPAFVTSAMSRIRPFRSINGYGLFRVMTTRRPEIIIEGSNDGHEWKAYSFHYKPGDPARAPAFIGPHMPRLDWQMWFAALYGTGRTHWFTPLLARLLEGSPDVLALIEDNPFPDEPPKIIRAVLYDYHFSDAKAHDETGHWWEREKIGLYHPPITRSHSER